MLPMEVAYQFAGVALPDGKEGGHVDASEVFLAVGAEIFEKNVTESHFADALAVEKGEGLSHGRFGDGVDALRRGEGCGKRQAERLELRAVEDPAGAGRRGSVHGVQTDRMLISIGKEVCDAALEGKATAEVVAGGEIETGVAGIVSDAQAVEVTVGADAGEIACQIKVDTPKAGAEPEVAGVHGATKKMIAGLLDSRCCADGFEDASVIVRIVSLQEKPVIQVGFAGPIHTASAGKIGIEIEHFVAVEADGVRGADLLVDQIAKLVGEVAGREAKAIGAEKLVDAKIEGAAAFRAQRRVARVARIGGKGFENGGFLNALAVRNSSASVSLGVLRTAESVDCNHTRDNACAQICVC